MVIFRCQLVQIMKSPRRHISGHIRIGSFRVVLMRMDDPPRYGVNKRTGFLDWLKQKSEESELNTSICICLSVCFLSVDTHDCHLIFMLSELDAIYHPFQPCWILALLKLSKGQNNFKLVVTVVQYFITENRKTI